MRKNSSRRTFSGAEKVAILKRHFVNGEKISDICDEVGLNPTLFYRWQKTFFENGATAFEVTNRPKADVKDRTIAGLKAKLVHKDSVISELASALVEAKKTLGISEQALGGA